MSENFAFDVFLSHSKKDKAVVRALAECLRDDGLRVWFDDWEIRPGMNIPSKLEEGLENSRVLVLCMSENAFGSDWATLESQSFRFRDPLNKELRFIPLRLDDAPIKGTLAQFSYVKWGADAPNDAYAKLREACRPPQEPSEPEKQAARERFTQHLLSLGHTKAIQSVAFSGDGTRALSGSWDQTVCYWDVESGVCLRILKGHSASVWGVSLSADGTRALSGSNDKTVRYWDVESGVCLRVLEGHSDWVRSVSLSADGTRALSGSQDNTVRYWDVESGVCLRVLEGHSDQVWGVSLSADGTRALSGSDNTVRYWDAESGVCLRVLEGHSDWVRSVSLSADGTRALSGSLDKTVRYWDVESGVCLRVLEGHSDWVRSVSLSADGTRALSGSDNTVRYWDVESGLCLRVLEGHSDQVLGVSLSADGTRALSGSDNTVRYWDVESGLCLRVLKGHSDQVLGVSLSADGTRALSGSNDKTVRYWDVESGVCLRILKGHSASVWGVSLSADGTRALSGSQDNTVRYWDVESGLCLRVLEGHSDWVRSVSLSADGTRALSGSQDNTVRYWDAESGLCLRVLEGHSNQVRSVSLSADGRTAYSVSENDKGRVWDLADLVEAAPPALPEQTQYTNAKVLLVGESGVGKTGLSNYLALGIKFEEGKPLASTDGAWATHWPLKHDFNEDGVDREIWLWDFAGQVDYRLVQQLFMDETAVAILVFNPQTENPFAGLGQWDHDLQKAARKPFVKLLSAGRVDRGRLVVSAEAMQRFMSERQFSGELHHTSAVTGEGCDALRTAIVEAIDWENRTVTSSPALYRHMKQEILRLRDSGMVLIRLAELKQRMEMALSGEPFDLDQLKTVIDLLAGPGMIQRLDFGGFILLRPEVLSRYAAALVRQVRRHPQELGCIREDNLLAGDLDYQDFVRLPAEDESVILHALNETVVQRAWCLRQASDGNIMLTFPSYFRRERKEQLKHPAVLVTYRYTGPSDDIYATLVVRLHHTIAFDIIELWKDAADYQTQTGQKLGIKLHRESEGTSRLEVYFEPDVDENSRVLFLRYVHEHLLERAKNVVRLRHYSCNNKRCAACGEPIEQSRIDRALASGGKGKLRCDDCDKVILLRDSIEQRFDAPETKEQVRVMQAEGQFAIDNESRELILVGHAFSIAGEAGQIYHGYTNSHHGIDGEIEFEDIRDRNNVKRLYLQLKSGDSYLITRQRDGAEVFQIKNPRWADYWQAQAYPVMLVIRTSNGEIRWMDVSAYLKRASAGGKTVTQIVFDGERFDAYTLRDKRDKILALQRR